MGRGVIVQADGKLVVGATIDSTDHGLDFGALR
jgi:hypothetical protein